jgi:hypothetical protein
MRSFLLGRACATAGSFSIFCSLAIACTDTSASSTSNDADAASVADAANAQPDSNANDLPLGKAPACKSAGGICVGAGSCVRYGGAVTLASSAGGCSASEGAAECCIPAKPVTSPQDCQGQGGVCAPELTCGETDGWTSVDDTCGGAGDVCCVPHAACGDATFDCCAGTTHVAPQCSSGLLQCPRATTPCAAGSDH